MLKFLGLAAGIAAHWLLLHLPVVAMLGFKCMSCHWNYLLFLAAMGFCFWCDSSVPVSPVVVDNDRISYIPDPLLPVSGLIILGLHWSCLYDCLAGTTPREFVWWLVALAGTMMIGGLWLRWSAIQSLGDFFTVPLQVLPTQPLITHGVYSHIRHPSYCGLLLVNLGLILLTRSELGLCFWLLLLPMILRRLSKEEAAMVAGFPDYQDYQQRTRRLIPYLF